MSWEHASNDSLNYRFEKSLLIHCRWDSVSVPLSRHHAVPNLLWSVRGVYNSHSRGDTNSSFQSHRKQMSLNNANQAQFPRLNQTSTTRIWNVTWVQPSFLLLPSAQQWFKIKRLFIHLFSHKSKLFSNKTRHWKCVFLRRARLHCCASWSIFWKFRLMFSLK